MLPDFNMGKHTSSCKGPIQWMKGHGIDRIDCVFPSLALSVTLEGILLCLHKQHADLFVLTSCPQLSCTHWAWLFAQKIPEACMRPPIAQAKRDRCKLQPCAPETHRSYQSTPWPHVPPLRTGHSRCHWGRPSRSESGISGCSLDPVLPAHPQDCMHAMFMHMQYRGCQCLHTSCSAVHAVRIKKTCAYQATCAGQ